MGSRALAPTGGKGGVRRGRRGTAEDGSASRTLDRAQGMAPSQLGPGSRGALPVRPLTAVGTVIGDA